MLSIRGSKISRPIPSMPQAARWWRSQAHHLLQETPVAIAVDPTAPTPTSRIKRMRRFPPSRSIAQRALRRSALGLYDGTRADSRSYRSDELFVYVTSRQGDGVGPTRSAPAGADGRNRFTGGNRHHTLFGTVGYYPDTFFVYVANQAAIRSPRQRPTAPMATLWRIDRR